MTMGGVYSLGNAVLGFSEHVQSREAFFVQMDLLFHV